MVSIIGKFPAPGTILEIKKLWPYARIQGKSKGQLWEVGYYCKHCGEGIIWLVDNKGEYSWTIELSFLLKHFDVIKKSTNRKWYRQCDYES